MKLKRFLLLILDLFFATRPLLLIPVWGFTAFGAWCAANQSGNISLVEFWNLLKSIVYIKGLIFSLSVAAVYLLNQVADLETDTLNGGLPLLASGIVDKNSVFSAIVVLGTLSIVTPLLLGDVLLALLSISSIIIGILYSFKPTYFSGRPILDFFTNAVGYGIIAFAAGWHFMGEDIFSLLLFKEAIIYILLMCAGSISSTIPDIEGDKSTGKVTTAVWIGKYRANILAFLFIFSALIISIIYKSLPGIVCSLFPMPLYIGYIMYRTQILMESTYKVGGAICMVIASVLVPAMIPISLFTFGGTLLYFRFRHKVSYPSLTPLHNA